MKHVQSRTSVHLSHAFASDCSTLQEHKHGAVSDCRAFPTCNLKRSSSRLSYAETGYFCSWKKFDACGYSKESRYLCSRHLHRNSTSVASDGSFHKQYCTAVCLVLSTLTGGCLRLRLSSVPQPRLSAKQSCLVQLIA